MCRTWLFFRLPSPTLTPGESHGAAQASTSTRASLSPDLPSRPAKRVGCWWCTLVQTRNPCRRIFEACSLWRTMRIAVTFPQHVIGVDPIAVRDWAQTAEGLGFDHIVA